MPQIYLDHSATTPTHPQVVQAMLPYFTEVFGNASSGHSFGRSAEAAIEKARYSISRVLNCKPTEIVFTSGGSESDNLAVRGAAWSAYNKGKRRLITTGIEHGAIGKTIGQLAKLHGFEEVVLPVDQFGRVNPADFAAACTTDTCIASVMYANNEVGTVQPIAELGAIARKQGVVFHTDAVQAAGQLPLDVQQLGVDLLSISAHKFYGPKGIGALYIREGIELVTAQTGGEQEHGLRAGTYSTPLIVGLAAALSAAYENYAERTTQLRQLRDQLIAGVLSHVPQAHLTGHPEQRLPSHASFVFDGLDNGRLLDELDQRGIAASAASACKTGSPKPSGVLLALGYSPTLAASSLRLTVGLHTTPEDIDYTIDVLGEIVPGLCKKTIEPVAQ